MLLSPLLIIEIASVVITAADTQSEDVLRRFADTEALVQMLLNKIERLESQNMLQLTRIDELEKQLRYQEQHSSKCCANLERLVSTFESQSQKNDSRQTEITPDLISETVRNIGSINKARRAENVVPVAFFAKMDNHLEHAGVHQTFVFETVVTNIGNGYKERLGVFVAPVSGMYVFTTTLVSFYHVSAHASFIKNGQAVTVMFVSGGEAGYDTTSQTIVLMLQQGDEISVQNGDPDKSFYGGSHSTFAGFLLQEGSSFTTIIGK